MNLLAESVDPSKKGELFVRPLELKGRPQNTAEVNIMMVAINPSINLYAQLTIVAEIRAKEVRPSFRAGAVLPIWLHRQAYP